MTDQAPEITKLLDDGLAAHGAGDKATARTKFEKAVEIAPTDPEALHLFGLTLEDAGERKRAIELIEKAVKIDPREPIFRMNLCAILEKERRFEEAHSHIDAALAQKPDASDILKIKGDILLAEGRSDDAAIIYRRAIEHNRRNADAIAGYGRAIFQKGELNEATSIANQALQASPTSQDALLLGMEVSKASNHNDTVVALARQWKQYAGRDVASLKRLCECVHSFGFWDESINIMRAILEIEPENASLLEKLGGYYVSAQRYDEAEAVLEKADRLAPGSADVKTTLARIRFYQGDMEAARQLGAEALDIDPDSIPALAVLNDIDPTSLTDSQFDTLERLVLQNNSPPRTLGQLWHAIGNNYHARQQFDRAFDAFHLANKCVAQANAQIGATFKPAVFQASNNQILEIFSHNSQAPKLSITHPAPIFIIGMPRSGTTLLESILSTNGNVFPAGEITRMPTLIARVTNGLRANELHQDNLFAPEYLEKLRADYLSIVPVADKQFFTDKQPTNFRALGLIRYLFPDAKIIHIRRNPLETGFSIYRHPFNREWSFACDFSHIAAYYGEYSRMMAHWNRFIGDNICFVQYETLTENAETETKRLFEFCGLDWSPDILDFYKSNRAVNTFSAAQVRKPITPAKNTALENYKSHLQPLIDGLRAANIDLETGAYLGD